MFSLFLRKKKTIKESRQCSLIIWLERGGSKLIIQTIIFHSFISYSPPGEIFFPSMKSQDFRRKLIIIALEKTFLRCVGEDLDMHLTFWENEICCNLIMGVILNKHDSFYNKY